MKRKQIIKCPNCGKIYEICKLSNNKIPPHLKSSGNNDFKPCEGNDKEIVLIYQT